ncbi:MAG: ATP-dependent endonuclease [Candidatus Hodarchaeota archaeon]
MKIKSFEIKNFRSIRNIHVETKDLMVFIGKNNAGKSNILRGLNAFFERKVLSEDIPPKHFQANEIEITVIFTDVPRQVRKKLDILEHDLIITRKFTIDEDAVKLGVELINNREVKRGFSNELDKISDVRKFITDALPKYYYVPALRNLADSEKFKKGSLMQDLLLPFLDDSIFDDGLSISDNLFNIRDILQKRSATIEANLNQLLLGRIEDFKRVVFSFDHVDIKKALVPGLMVETENTDKMIPAISQGAGTQNFLILALAQYYASGKFPRDLIIAFEEPEISLHAGAQRKMWALITNLSQIIQQQIFVTTHSTIFIDENVENIYLVKKKGGETTVTPPRLNIEILKTMGIRGSDYFHSDALIFVEGLSDYKVFRSWAEVTPPDSWEGIYFTFIPLGGLSALSDYKREDFLRLTHRIYCIIDSDKSSRSSKVKSVSREIVEKVQQLGGKIKMLNVRSLENYFTEEAVREVWPNGIRVIDSTKFDDPYADMEDHLREIKREDNRVYFTQQGIYDKEKNKLVVYSKAKDGKRIADVMIKHGDIPEEFLAILDEFGKDFRAKYDTS